MTKKIKSITPKEINEIKTDILEALKAIEKEYGVSIVQKGNIGYTDLSFKLPLEIAVLNQEAFSAKAEENFNRYVTMYNLNTDGFRKPFTHNGTKYQVIDINFRAKKFPFVVERLSDGERYKFTIDAYLGAFPDPK